MACKYILTFGACNSRVAEIPGRTRAHRLMVLHAAKRVRGARIQHGARVQALPINAGGVRRALGVVAALGG